jgi:hypothetical protein
MNVLSISNPSPYTYASFSSLSKSLSLLINELTEQSTDREILLAATILLGSYELLAQPGIDYQRHLYGAHSLISTRNMEEEGTAFEKASF